MTSQLADTSLSSNFFWRFFVSLVKFSYWSKFHVNIITDSGIMTILFYKGLTGNTLYGFCPISGDWGELWIPNLAQMSLIECYWMLQNSRVTAFTVFELLRENQLGSGSVKLPPLSQIRVNEIHLLVENKKKKTPFGGDILCHRLSCLFLFSFFFLFDILVCRLKFVHKSMVGSDETSWSIFKYFLNFALK